MVELEVTGWAAGGRGVARHEGRVFLVAGGVPGDRLRARIVGDHGRWVEARCEEISRPSSERREPPCGLQSECGGCPLMTIGEEPQREAKRRFVQDAVERIGGLRGLKVEPTRSAGALLNYRNKIELTFGLEASGRLILGYHRGADPGSLVDVPACAIADRRLAPLLDLARSFFLDADGPRDPALLPPGDPLRLVLRASGGTDETLIAFRGPEGPFPAAEAFARSAYPSIPGLAGVVRVLATPGRRGGSRMIALAGEAWLAETLLGLSFRIPASTFLQVNARGGEILLRHVVEGAGAPPAVLDLYAGVGAIGLALARTGSRATIVEADRGAIACGRETAARAGIEGTSFVASDVLRFLQSGGSSSRPELIVADPPRTGLGRGVAAGIAALRAPRIAMVSCDPATLARDLAQLCGRGYTVERITPFDLFPQTAHVEAVAWLTRNPERAGAG